MAIVRDLSGNSANNASAVDPHYDKDAPTYQLAFAQTLNIGQSTTPVSVAAGTYIFDTQGTYGGGTITLESRGSDNATWSTVTTRTAVGQGTAPIYFGSNALVRLTASVANVTNLSASLT